EPAAGPDRGRILSFRGVTHVQRPRLVAFIVRRGGDPMRRLFDRALRLRKAGALRDASGGSGVAFGGEATASFDLIRLLLARQCSLSSKGESMCKFFSLALVCSMGALTAVSLAQVHATQAAGAKSPAQEHRYVVYWLTKTEGKSQYRMRLITRT